MTTLTEACRVIRTIMEGDIPLNPESGSPIELRWRGEPAPPLPDVPTPFVFTFFGAARSSVIENGGEGANRHRNPAVAAILVFVPNDWGEAPATDIAEGFAARFRSYKDNGVTVEDATVYPGGHGSDIAVPGLTEPGNYIWAGCEVEFHFDKIG